MASKRLLRCPTCRDAIAELDSSGNLVILRYGSDKRRSTIVVSPNMVVVCGKCNEVVFYRKK